MMKVRRWEAFSRRWQLLEHRLLILHGDARRIVRRRPMPFKCLFRARGLCFYGCFFESLCYFWKSGDTRNTRQRNRSGTWRIWPMSSALKMNGRVGKRTGMIRWTRTGYGVSDSVSQWGQRRRLGWQRQRHNMRNNRYRDRLKLGWKVRKRWEASRDRDNWGRG